MRVARDDVSLQLPIEVTVPGETGDLVADLAQFNFGAFAKFLLAQHPKSVTEKPERSIV